MIGKWANPTRFLISLYGNQPKALTFSNSKPF